MPCPETHHPLLVVASRHRLLPNHSRTSALAGLELDPRLEGDDGDDFGPDGDLDNDVGDDGPGADDVDL